MARKIKRFLVFMLFSLFFAMFSKKIQTTDSSSKTNGIASAQGNKTKSSFGQVLSSVVGVNSAQASVSCECNSGDWYCG